MEDFETTRKNLDSLNMSKIHVFPYSRRIGTVADKLPNQVDDVEKKKRVSIIQEISDRKNNEFLQRNIDSENEVIVEKNRDKKSGLLKGVTKNYINVLIDDKDNYKDELVKVKITNLSDYPEKVIAEII